MHLVVVLSILGVDAALASDFLSNSCACVSRASCTEGSSVDSIKKNATQRDTTPCRGVCGDSCPESEVCCLSPGREYRAADLGGGEERGSPAEVTLHEATMSPCVCLKNETCFRGFLDISQLAALGGSLFSSPGQCSERGEVCCRLLCSCVTSHRCHDVALIAAPEDGGSGYCGPGQVCCSGNSTEGLDVSSQSAETYSDQTLEQFCQKQPLSISCPGTRKRNSVPTIIESSDFQPEEDAAILRNSFGIGRGTAAALISILTNRTFRQRDIISQTYFRLYDSDLYNDASFWTVGLAENTVQHLLRASSPSEYLAIVLDRATSGPGTDEHAVIETLVTSTAQQLTLISQLFSKLTGQSLEARIRRDFSGHVATLLLAMVRQERSTNTSTDLNLAQIQAQKLYKAGEAALGTDEAVFVDLLSRLHWTQLYLVQSQYYQLTGSDLEQAINREFSGDLRRVLTAIVQVSENVPRYLAHRLNANLANLRREDEDLIRILVSRSEIDLATIAHEYELNYQQNLADTIEWKTFGSYEDILLAILASP